MKAQDLETILYSMVAPSATMTPSEFCSLHSNKVYPYSIGIRDWKLIIKNEWASVEISYDGDYTVYSFKKGGFAFSTKETFRGNYAARECANYIVEILSHLTQKYHLSQDTKKCLKAMDEVEEVALDGHIAGLLILAVDTNGNLKVASAGDLQKAFERAFSKDGYLKSMATKALLNLNV